MTARKLLLFASVIAGTAAYRRFRSQQLASERRLLEGSTVVETRLGPVEYAEEGSGAPLLVIHGAGGGYDQGLMIGRDLRHSFRIIAPSRFGYLRTPVPDDCSSDAQAETHLALLDHLQVGHCVVMGVSAGAPSALALAMRHPDRVTALILLSPRLYHPEQTVSADSSVPSRAVLGLLESASDFLFWLAVRLARPAVVRFLGVPPELEARASFNERERVTALVSSMLPLSRRLPGLKVDGDVLPEDAPLEQLQMPTLIISAADDLYQTLPGAELAASRIPGALLRSPPSGGHLLVGCTDEITGWVEEFVTGAAKVGPGRQRMLSPKTR